MVVMSRRRYTLRPRVWPRRAAAAVGVVVCVACVALWVWGRREVRYVQSDFWEGWFVGDREWRGSYLGVFRGQLFFESQRVLYAAPPAPRPTNRWAAEDAVGLRTPALRSFPFDGPLGFQYVNDIYVSDAGSLHTLRVAFPLWAAAVPAALMVVYPFVRLWVRRA